MGCYRCAPWSVGVFPSPPFVRLCMATSARVRTPPPTQTGRVRKLPNTPSCCLSHQTARLLGSSRKLSNFCRRVARAQKASTYGLSALSGVAKQLTAKMMPIRISLEGVVLVYQINQQVLGNIFVAKFLTQFGVRLRKRNKPNGRNSTTQTKHRRRHAVIADAHRL